jgi:hypothetical protein
LWCISKWASQPAKQFMTRLTPTGNTHITHRHLLFCYTAKMKFFTANFFLY